MCVCVRVGIFVRIWPLCIEFASSVHGERESASICMTIGELSSINDCNSRQLQQTTDCGYGYVADLDLFENFQICDDEMRNPFSIVFRVIRSFWMIIY